MSRTFKVLVRETCEKEVTVEAGTADAALDRVREQYNDGELVFDGDDTVTLVQMAVAAELVYNLDWEDL